MDNTRREKGFKLARLARRGAGAIWTVPSETRSSRTYVVDPDAGTCTCPDHRERGVKCKHVWAVEHARRVDVPDTGSLAAERSQHLFLVSGLDTRIDDE